MQSRSPTVYIEYVPFILYYRHVIIILHVNQAFLLP